MILHNKECYNFSIIKLEVENMAELKSKKRDINVKGKKLRREGIIPCVIYGKHMSEPVNIQIMQKDAEHFLKGHAAGSKLELIVGRKKHMALLKEISYVPVSNAIEHLSFQDLTAGEKATASAHIVLLHKDKVEGIIQQSLSEISYSALPDDFIEHIEIDLTGHKHGDIIKVQDLPEAKDERLEIHTPLEDIIISIGASKEMTEPVLPGEEPVEIKISGTTVTEVIEAKEEPEEAKGGKEIKETKATKSRMTKETKQTLAKEKGETIEPVE